MNNQTKLLDLWQNSSNTPPPAPPRSRGGEVLALDKTGVGFFFLIYARSLLTAATITIALSSMTVGTVLAQAKLTNQSKLLINGFGSVKVGMTVSQATKAAGTKLIGDPPNNNCYYVKPQGEPKEIGFMVTEGKISRVDVWKKSKITTLKGAKVGDTEARIKSLYPQQIQVTPHKYFPGGHYLTFVPKDRADQNYRIIFETDGKRVTKFRSGKLPEVEFVEGCS